jgi:acyl-CoA synthetase (AMP-forming)/AMP-acid ligase II
MESSALQEDIVNVARFLPMMAEQQGQRLALRVPGGRLGDGRIAYQDDTFAELNREVDARCHQLTEAGIARGTKVLVMVKPGRDLIALVFAMFKMGAVPVLIDPGMGLKGFLNCVRRSQPEALVAIPLGVWVSRVFRAPFRSVKTVVTVRTQPRIPVGQCLVPFAVAPTSGNDLAAVLFTSGSTGPAKGVLYQHRMFEAQVELIREQYAIRPGEVDLPMLPVFALFNPALGMTTVVPEINPSRPATVDPAKIVQAIQQCQVTNTFGSPVLWKKIGRYCLEREIQLPSLQRILMAGAPVPPQLIRDFRRILPHGAIHTPYGATESLPVTSISGVEILEETQAATDSGRGTCVGRPLPRMEVRILPLSDRVEGPEFLEQPLPSGEVGEIAVRGPVVTEAYDHLPEATAGAKIEGKDGIWHRIGDLGYLDESGRLWFCGRKAERVETPSGRLYTDCCEAIFNRHPRVHRCALIGLGPVGSQAAAIVVEPEPGQFPRRAAERAVWVAELKDLGASTPATAKIDRFFFHKSLPVDVRHNAKIHRRTLAKIYQGRKGG